MHCVADFCVIPMGVDASVSKWIAEAQRVVEQSGLVYKMHGYGTGIEGEWSQVMATIEAVHDRLHQLGVPRCATDIRVGTRMDKQGSLEAKVSSVMDILHAA